jgi:hypothetical protein
VIISLWSLRVSPLRLTSFGKVSTHGVSILLVSGLYNISGALRMKRQERLTGCRTLRARSCRAMASGVVVVEGAVWSKSRRSFAVPGHVSWTLQHLASPKND